MSDKLPWFPFYISDWENDRRVRAMGPVARSYFLTLLILQWREGSLPADRKTLQRLLVLPCDPLRSDLQLSLNSDPNQRMDGIDHEAVLDQVLECFDLTDSGVLMNDRLNSIREQQLRVVEAKSKGGKHSSKSAKGVLQESSKIAGVKTESNTNISSEGYATLDSQVMEIARLHPKVRDAFNLSQELQIAIAEAIGRDGRDLVWAGTKCYAEAVSKWPPSEKQFTIAPPRFFRDSQYLTDPREWERSSNGRKQEPSKAIARADRLHETIARGVGADLSRRVETDGDERQDGPRRTVGA